MRSFLLICILLFVFSSCSQGEEGVISQACFDQACFNVELAQTDEELQKGLMHRTTLAKDAGMLFLFKASQPRVFWMKNTLIALDMIWIDENKKVVGVTPLALPCKQDPCLRYPSKVSAQYVLEIKAGMAQRVGIHVGQQMQLR